MKAMSQWMWVVLLILITGTVSAQDVSTRLFFDSAQVRNMQLSPDARHVAFTFEEGSEVKLGIMDPEDRELLTVFGFGDKQHVVQFLWGNNERVIMSVATVTGNLDNQRTRPPALYAANIDGKRREQIYDTSRSSYQILHPYPQDPNRILIARYHFADGGQPKAQLLNIYNGNLNYIADQPNSRDIRALIADNSGTLRVAVELIDAEQFDDLEFNLFVKKDDQWTRFNVDSERERPDITPLGFSADNTKLYLSSNHDMAQNDRAGVFRYDFETDELELLYRHSDVDVSSAMVGSDGEVLGVMSLFGPGTYTFLEDKASTNEEAILLQRLAASFPADDVSLTSYSEDGTKAILFVRGARNPGEFYLFDTQTMAASYVAGVRPDLPKDALVQMQMRKIKARDGMELHTLLTLPDNQNNNLPLIVNVHGGPFGITDQWGFNPEAQFFAHHGYATLQVNFRGSGNRGDDFERAGRLLWGKTMQDDVTDATQWAIDQGIADPNRICIAGGSYGGYAALWGVIKEPDLYQCAVGIVGVYDMKWFREGDGSDFSGNDMAFERFMISHVAETSEGIEAISPVHHVDKIKAELFIVHGGSDVRVPVGHAYRLRDALSRIGKSYEWMIKEEEGHGFFNVDNRVELYNQMLAFFDRHIGGGSEAAQTAMSPADQ